jgi:hypothetical protein
MNKKIIGIFVIILLVAISIPVVGGVNVNYDEKTQGFKWIIYMFVWGKVENITEESINGAPYYNCTAVNVRYFWLWYAYPTPFWLEFERRRVWNQDGFLIAKEIFHGIIGEGFILGIVFNSGEEISLINEYPLVYTNK